MGKDFVLMEDQKFACTGERLSHNNMRRLSRRISDMAIILGKRTYRVPRNTGLKLEYFNIETFQR